MVSALDRMRKTKLADSFGDGYVEFVNTAVKHNFETLPRDTIVRMLKEKGINEPFVFNVPKGTAAHYIGAMRAVLSRSRRKAAKQKRQLQEFKLLVLDVEHAEDHDIVSLTRTQSKSQRTISAYDPILDQLTLGPKNDRP